MLEACARKEAFPVPPSEPPLQSQAAVRQRAGLDGCPAVAGTAKAIRQDGVYPLALPG